MPDLLGFVGDGPTSLTVIAIVALAVIGYRLIVGEWPWDTKPKDDHNA